MAGDGISVQTNIAQLGNVARSQAKGQQAQQSATTFSEKVDKQEELRVQRVKETDKTEKQKINPDGEDRRKRRRQRRKRAREERASRNAEDRSPDRVEEKAAYGDEPGAEAAAEGERSPAPIGGLVDTRV
jgi:hypothetical protein